MSKRIDATSHSLSMIPDGSMCLTLQSGTGTFEIYFPAALWALMSKNAQWFDANVSKDGVIADLARERENALKREIELGSQLRAMTEARNELAKKLEQYNENDALDETVVEED